jgi:hypothetical protein
MKHYGNKQRTLASTLADLQQELRVSRRLDVLTVEELHRRYSRLKPIVIEAELKEARRRAAMTPEQRFQEMLRGARA